MSENKYGREQFKNSEVDDYLELQSENHEEHEKWDRNLKEVVGAMKQKRDELTEVVKGMQSKQAGRQNIRTLIIVMGGGMQGAYAAGQLRALQVMGYTEKNVTEKDTLLGISVGAPMSAFALAGLEQGLMGMTYFYTVCASKAFINFLRFQKIIDVSVLDQNLRSGALKLDVDSVKGHPCQFYVQAFNKSTKQPEFINAKEAKPDLVSAIHASVAIPVIYGETVIINDCLYSDGGFDDPLPIERAIKKFNPTHVLILPNRPFGRVEKSPFEDLGSKILPEGGILGLLKKLLKNRKELRGSLDFIANTHNVKIGIAWPPDAGLSQFSQEKGKIKNSMKVAGKDLFKLFGEPEKVITLFEEEHGEVPLLQTSLA
jgi:predicted patatin/cPLA2 family phospholipase